MSAAYANLAPLASVRRRAALVSQNVGCVTVNEEARPNAPHITGVPLAIFLLEAPAMRTSAGGSSRQQRCAQLALSATRRAAREALVARVPLETESSARHEIELALL